MQPDYSRIALRDIDEIAESISRERPNSAIRFLKGVEKTVQRLLDFPQSAGRYESDDPELEGLRVTLVKGFKKYLLFYRIHGESIFIERVLHGARNLDDLL